MDAAADKAVKGSELFSPDRKKRVVYVADTVSALMPPPDAPEWTVKSDYRNDCEGIK